MLFIFNFRFYYKRKENKCIGKITIIYIMLINIFGKLTKKKLGKKSVVKWKCGRLKKNIYLTI